MLAFAFAFGSLVRRDGRVVRRAVLGVFAQSFAARLGDRRLRAVLRRALVDRFEVIGIDAQNLAAGLENERVVGDHGHVMVGRVGQLCDIPNAAHEKGGRALHAWGARLLRLPQ